MSLKVRRPETRRIDLSDGDYIIVKKHLTAGEQRAIFRRMMRDGVTGDTIDSVRVGWSKIVGYLLDWSATDADGNAIPISGKSEDEIGAAVDALPTEAFTEILRAVEAHEDEMEKVRAAEKNARGGESKSSAISPSLDTLAGAMSGLPSSPLMSTTS